MYKFNNFVLWYCKKIHLTFLNFKPFMLKIMGRATLLKYFPELLWQKKTTHEF